MIQMKRRDFIQNASIGLATLFEMPFPLNSSPGTGLARNELPKSQNAFTF